MNNIQEDITEEELKVRSEYRDSIDLLRSRLSILSGQDKLMMTMYWENGNTLRQISTLAGVSRLCIARRIDKITKRLMEGPYIICLRNRDKFTRRQMVIAKEYYLLGLSMKKIAGKRDWSYYRVRQILQRIKSVLELVSNETCKSKLTDDEKKELVMENGGMVNADM
jgi:predicted DNA-binding protein YlxM (UPF0122 family)